MMSKDQTLYAMRYACEFEYTGFHMFAMLMFALFKNDAKKHTVSERELQLNRKDLEKVLDTLYDLLKLDVDEKLCIEDVEFVKGYDDDKQIFDLITNFKEVLFANPNCDDFKFTNY